MTRVTYYVTGSIIGDLWWPIGEPGTKTFSYRTAERPESLRALADSVMAEEDGDFSSAPRMTADSVLVITRWRATSHHSRAWDLSQFGSIADYMTDEYAPFDDGYTP